jgi:hypothetical protein
LEDLGEYVVWLQLPPSGRRGQIAVLPTVEPHISALGHSSVTTTSAIYGHLTVEDARSVLEKAGWFRGTEVQW